MSSKVSNINDYTLIERGDLVNNIYFYPNSAINKQKVRSKKNQICVLFELRKEKEPLLYCLYTYLLDKEGRKVFHSYSLYLKEIERFKYVLLRNKNDANHAEDIKKEILDFNTLDYDKFLNILSNNYELSKMIPDLKEALEEKAESLIKEKKKASFIDIPSMNNYYQNMIGYLTDQIEEQITTEDELDLSRNILKNIKKNFEVVLYDKYQTNLAYTAIYASLLNNVKGTHISPSNILEAKDLKTDTNKTSLKLEDLIFILNSFINNLKEDTEIEEELNIVQERIEYILTTKSRIKEMTKFVKVILIDDEYVDSTKRNCSIKEYSLKELIISSLMKHSYRPLPRNQVLLYNEKDSVIDFIAIVSLDMVMTLLQTYKISSTDENKDKIETLHTIENIILKGQKKKSKNTLKLSIMTLLHMVVYNYKNINQKALLFDKGKYILKLDYNVGAYDIKVIDRDTEKKYGKLSKLTQETNELVRKSLNKGEKSFNAILNQIIYKSIEESLNTYNYKIEINDLTNKDVIIKVLKPYKEDYFECTFNIGELLYLISTIKPQKEKVKIAEEVTEEIVEDQLDEQVEENIDNKKLTQEEKDYIIRKSNTIVTIMNTKPLDNENYIKVVELYNKLTTATAEEKDDILLELKDLI